MIWLAVLLFQAAAGTPQTEPAQATTFSGPPQAQRGYKLFFESTKGQPCGACHVLAGRGTPAGPDLKAVARLPARAFVMAIKSTRTQYVQKVEPKTGDPFPAMKVKEDDKVVELYDLSKTPPELRKIEKAEISSMKDNDSWKHPPSSLEYTNEELADIIAFIKWVGYRHSAGVKASEL